jgi:hypothetical protein
MVFLILWHILGARVVHAICLQDLGFFPLAIIVEIVQLEERSRVKVVNMMFLYNRLVISICLVCTPCHEGAYQPYAVSPTAHLDQLAVASDARHHELQPAPK